MALVRYGGTRKQYDHPTDAKQCKKRIAKRGRIEEAEEIKLKRSYKRESKQLPRGDYDGKHPRRAKKARKAKAVTDYRNPLKTLNETHNFIFRNK